MKENEIIFIARNERKQVANVLAYIIPKREFVVCSNFTQIGDEITWDWGHYYTDFKNAILKLYENEIYDIEKKVINAMYNSIIPEIDKIEKQIYASDLYNAEEVAEKEIEKIFKNYYEE